MAFAQQTSSHVGYSLAKQGTALPGTCEPGEIGLASIGNAQDMWQWGVKREKEKLTLFNLPATIGSCCRIFG